MKLKKTFDCVEMKHQLQQRVYDEIKDLTHEQELAYYRRAIDDSSPIAQFLRRLTPATVPGLSPAPSKR
jgi:hypothetical protein